MSSASRPNTRGNIARQRRFWNHQAEVWDEQAGANVALASVVDAVLVDADARPDMHALDLGCGSGQLTLKLAPLVGSVVGVDVSQRMIDLLEHNARDAGIGNVTGLAAPIEALDITPTSVDLVVTNYVLHHLRDEDKSALVRTCFDWLRPGGRFVIGDMMFGRGGDARDRQIIASKLVLFTKKGPGGWWRIVKNLGRFVLRMQERPISARAWTELLRDAGFSDITTRAVVNEAAIVTGTRPAPQT